MEIVRPARTSPSVTAYAAELILEKLGFNVDDESRMEEMDGVLRECSDTFDILKCLEDDAWKVDDTLIRTVLQRDNYIDQALMLLIPKWVKDHGIVAQKRFGDTVELTVNGQVTKRMVTGISHKNATYWVGSATHGNELVPFEWVHPLAEPAEDFKLRQYSA
jgi:hypothetical protein